MFAVRIAQLVAVSLLIPAAALAQPMAGASHLFQDPRDHVVLRSGYREFRVGEPSCPSSQYPHWGLFRVLPDGQSESQPFGVPEGRLLVVTDVEWQVGPRFDLPDTPFQAGASVTASLAIGSPGELEIVWRSATITVDALGSRVGGSAQLTTGFAVAPDTLICPEAFELVGELSYPVRVYLVYLRGYLVDAAPAS